MIFLRFNHQKTIIRQKKEGHPDGSPPKQHHEKTEHMEKTKINKFK